MWKMAYHIIFIVQPLLHLFDNHINIRLRRWEDFGDRFVFMINVFLILKILYQHILNLKILYKLSKMFQYNLSLDFIL